MRKNEQLKQCINCPNKNIKLIRNLCEKCYGHFRFKQELDKFSKLPPPVFPQFNFIQEQIITASMLGDGCIRLPKRAVNPSLRIERKLTDKDYILWAYEYLKDYCTSNGLTELHRLDKRTKKNIFFVNFNYKINS